VLTLDAGGTTFTFAAMDAAGEAAPPVTVPCRGDDLAACLEQIVQGFARARAAAGGTVAAISFAFPGPADYPAGVIGDLPNLPAFRGGVALGPMLQDHFGVPVYINNDGDLFTYGEALFGLLPHVNRQLEQAGSAKRYRNLLGITLGTGFGGGIVSDGRVFRGDNSAAGEIWLMRNHLDAGCCAEEGASLRAVRRAYAGAAGISLDAAPDPRQIDAIASGSAPGDAAAARQAFQRLGQVAGDAVANALTLLDGLVVVGGGLAAAAAHFLPALVAELNGTLGAAAGARVPRTELTAFNLEDGAGRAQFLAGRAATVAVPGSTRRVAYDPQKRTGVGLSRLGTSRAVALGAYAYALEQLDRAAAAPAAAAAPGAPVVAGEPAAPTTIAAPGGT
jgi:glucokinase